MAPNSANIVGPIPELLDSGQYQVIFWSLLAFACAFLVMTVFIFLCSSCDGSPENDDNLMSMPSEKETNSYPLSSRNELPANGHTESLTNGDDQSTIVNSSEDALLPIEPNQQDAQCKSSKCPQSRELPQIPGNDSMPTTESTEVNEAKTLRGVCNTYEVLKDSSLQDIIIEDSLYETVKELKEESGSVVNEIYGQAENTDLNIMVQDQNHNNAGGTAAYATVSKVKMNRSISTEQILITEDDPPPIPIKQLDENAEIAAMYSTVSKSAQQWLQADAEQEGGYACIDEVTPRKLPSTPNHLYASVSDYEGAPRVTEQTESVDAGGEDVDPGYEAIKALKEALPEQKAESNGNQSTCLGENHYESICEMDQK
ncbi:phosphoprotein associated with glycosphingolipid-enriched microdomains 1 isoform X2 [Pristis pectinata]|uniref:phosphoprotein associated with glycosphingolipid-enriched microdomains 1 isoform X2 n=1 Tax=Pristis pectinata TaxID=685728 RepID=UPI00223E8A92|nr:phosphoprotein associated with glycosphingolipid-enriched microdomains 1 isoform X2 [Pristis pectinata]